MFVCMLVADCLRSISLSLESVKIKQRHESFKRCIKAGIFACFKKIYIERERYIYNYLMKRPRKNVDQL